MGTFTAPTIANIALALSARFLSSIADCKEKYPIYKNNKISSDVNLASHTHQAPHMGLPQNEPVTNAAKVNMAPVGEIALAIICDSLAFNINPIAA